MPRSTELGLRARSSQRGQAIALVALIIVVLFGFLGLALDGGRGYVDRREMQNAADASALAAAYNYMNTSDYALAEQAAASEFANNERLFATPSCSGVGTSSAYCTFGDPTQQVLTVTVASHSIAGTTFTTSASHHIPVTVMQVLGWGSTITVGASATAVARRSGTYGAAIQTLSPGNCNGLGQSLVFTGTSTTNVAGDVWSNGSITDNGVANGSITGNAIDICPSMPPVPLPNFTVSGVQANGFALPDPGYAEPGLGTTTQSWNSANGSTELPGTYSADPKLSGGAGCYFLAGGVYDFAGGITQNGGFISNELRPPDEPELSASGVPMMATTTAALPSGTVNSIPVTPLAAPIPGSTRISILGQTFAVSSGGAASGATSISLANNQSAAQAIASGAQVTVRALPQFWDSNGTNCSTTFSLSVTGADSNNPAVNSQTWAVELTAVRWSPNGVSSCSGPGSPTCYLRESAPSMCKAVTVGSSQVFKVTVSSSPADPGAQDFNVYLAPGGSCTGPFGYAAEFANAGNYGMTVNGSTLSGWTLNAGGALDTPGAPPPDAQSLPVAGGLPNANPAAGTPPHGDLANEADCVDTSTGNNVACPSSWTPGAVSFFIPGGGSQSVCLNLQGGGDIYVFSGYQYQRILLFEPGPEQNPPANMCLNNVAGHGITSLIGIFYVPAASVTIIGNSSYLATIAGGVIAWTATVKGTGGVSISADPTLRTFPSAVHLTQ